MPCTRTCLLSCLAPFLPWLCCRLTYNLQSLDYSNNPGITGPIPPQMGLLEGLQVVRLQNTSLSCSGITRPFVVTTNASCSDPARCKTARQYGSVEAQQHVCAPSEQLPCFLRFSDYLIPREDNSNMRCRYIVRLPQEQAIEACSGSLPADLGASADSLPKMSSEPYDQVWYVDPSYYQYQENVCECLVVSWGVGGQELMAGLHLPSRACRTSQCVCFGVLIAH